MSKQNFNALRAPLLEIGFHLLTNEGKGGNVNYVINKCVISQALWGRSYAQNNDAPLRAATAQLTLLTGVTFMSVRHGVFHVPM